jgi:hypothetical protein
VANSADVSKVLQGLSEELGAFPDVDLLELGHLATTLILARTKKGLDADGKPFVQYTPRYELERTKLGLSRQPDLAVKGHMLGAILPTVTGKDEVSLLFANPLEAAKAAANDRIRNFFDIRAAKEIDMIGEAMGVAVEARVEKHLK